MAKKIGLLVGCSVGAFIMILIGQIIGGIIVGMPAGIVMGITGKELSGAWITAVTYVAFIGIWIVVIAYLNINKKDRPILDAIGTLPSGNTWKNFLIGLLLGFGMNGLCILIAWLNKDIHLTFDGFRPISFVLIFVCVLIQSSAEEVVCRGFLYQKAMKYFKKPVIAIVSNSMLFAVLHLFNDGITVLSVLNIFLTGILFSLLVYYMDSLWCAFAVHTAWNFSQNIIFGLPNSGVPATYSVFKLDTATATNSFAYNIGFGIEGTVIADLVLLLACVAIFLWGRKYGKPAYDVWHEDECA